MTRLLKKYKEQILYLFFGGATSVVGVGVYQIFMILGFPSEISNTVSTVLAVAFAYVTNKLFVFESKVSKGRGFWRELLSFAGGRLFTFLLETGLLHFFVVYKQYNSLVCKISTTALVIVLNYVISKKIVFVKK